MRWPCYEVVSLCGTWTLGKKIPRTRLTVGWIIHLVSGYGPIDGPATATNVLPSARCGRRALCFVRRSSRFCRSVCAVNGNFCVKKGSREDVSRRAVTRGGLGHMAGETRVAVSFAVRESPLSSPTAKPVTLDNADRLRLTDNAILFAGVSKPPHAVRVAVTASSCEERLSRTLNNTTP